MHLLVLGRTSALRLMKAELSIILFSNAGAIVCFVNKVVETRYEFQHRASRAEVGRTFLCTAVTEFFTFGVSPKTFLSYFDLLAVGGWFSKLFYAKLIPAAKMFSSFWTVYQNLDLCELWGHSMYNFAG